MTQIMPTIHATTGYVARKKGHEPKIDVQFLESAFASITTFLNQDFKGTTTAVYKSVTSIPKWINFLIIAKMP